jgi:integrase
MAVFMSQKTKATVSWSLASVALTDAYTDFILSRQAMNCAPTTLSFYKGTAGIFLSLFEMQGVIDTEQVTARIVRQYLAGLAAQKKADRTLHAHARAIKTLLKFWHREKYISAPVVFEMPKIAKKRLPVLNAEQLQTVVKACNIRDKAIVLFMADSGLRREEVSLLNWADVDMQSGLVRIHRGKGGKARISRVGATTRRALLAYRRTLQDREGALFKHRRTGVRLSGNALRLVYRRLTAITGIHVTPHAMRRTWALLSLRAGMDALHVKDLGGWGSIEMVSYYASLEDEDLMQAHRDHSPVDQL